MAEIRACVYLLVLLVTFQKCSPAYGDSLWCSLFCDDYEDDDDSEGGFDDILTYLFNPCGDCETKPAASPTASESHAEASSEEGTSTNPQKINLVLSPSNGANVTLENSGTGWLVNLVPWFSGGSATTPAPAASTTTPAGNDTAVNATAA